MTDIIEQIGSSTIHHGKNSNRVYLMNLDKQDVSNIAYKMECLAEKNTYTKIVAKIPDELLNNFLENGYIIEARIPKLYNGNRDGSFMCKYFDETRKTDAFKGRYLDILEIASQKDVQDRNVSLGEGYECRQAKEGDIAYITDLYQTIFKSYPFPIYDKNYIAKTMQDNVIYYGIWYKKTLVGLSSIEIDKKNSNAEMTDFAVLNEHRGKGLAFILLKEMEKRLKELNIKTAFTIARAKSAGMNITFAKSGYQYAGTLINNTDIAGQIESMNVWYKKASE